MSVELKLESYCDDCPYIDATTDRTVMYAHDVPALTFTNITCKNIDACRRAFKKGASSVEVKEEPVSMKETFGIKTLRGVVDLYNLNHRRSNDNLGVCVDVFSDGSGALLTVSYEDYLSDDRFVSYETYVITRVVEWVRELGKNGGNSK